MNASIIFYVDKQTMNHSIYEDIFLDLLITISNKTNNSVLIDTNNFLNFFCNNLVESGLMASVCFVIFTILTFVGQLVKNKIKRRQ